MKQFAENMQAKEHLTMARTYLSFSKIVDIIGQEDATALCEARGGLPVYVAKVPKKCSLRGLISACGLESLCAAFGGEEVTIPHGPFRKPTIKAHITNMLEAGRGRHEIATECRCTRTYVDVVARECFGPHKPH